VASDLELLELGVEIVSESLRPDAHGVVSRCLKHGDTQTSPLQLRQPGFNPIVDIDRRRDGVGPRPSRDRLGEPGMGS
jgi:hypothetical protein